MRNVFVCRTPIGRLRITEENGALVEASIEPGVSETAVCSSDLKNGAVCSPVWEDPEPCAPVLKDAAAWLNRYFHGTDPGPVPPLAPKGTAFQKAVWDAIGNVPYGKTTSYSALAVSMGLSPRHARAVGNALHRNPILLFIPCHRALGKNGALTGFAAGLPRKKALLELEQA